MRTLAAAVVVWLALMPAAMAVLPGEMLPDAKLEARARALSAELRCMVCQNQSIDDSDAPLAADIRVLLRERIAAGDTDDAVLDFLVARYGEFILLKPRFTWHTLLLWAAPPAALIAALAGAVIGYRSRKGAEPAVLSAEEAAALRRLRETGGQ